MISDFRREVGEDCTLLGCYAASSVNFLQTFRDSLSVPSSGGKYSCVLTQTSAVHIRERLFLHHHGCENPKLCKIASVYMHQKCMGFWSIGSNPLPVFNSLILFLLHFLSYVVAGRNHLPLEVLVGRGCWRTSFEMFVRLGASSFSFPSLLLPFFHQL